MKISSSAVSLNVDDVAASSGFLARHFGFTERMAADGFASLARDDAGVNVVFLRRGLATLPADQREDHARGLILAFVVEDLEGELARLRAEGVAITMPLTEEEWGERAFQVRDPNGVIVQLVDWNGTGEPAGDPAARVSGGRRRAGFRCRRSNARPRGRGGSDSRPSWS
ncbi:VOC family protein [Frankia canadensis]|uniref:VOC family protein n=1 Tax=Frankia canadensis TaxID=1836972 RepID=UPI000C7CD856|nr:VOC family protein [Frankia canadensis]